MGTVASLTLGDAATADADFDGLRSTFDDFDSLYSLYRSDSEISRLARGELVLPHTSAEFRATYAIALDWRARKNGDFTPHRPDGLIDLSGVVKALAMERAGLDLIEAGVNDWCLNVGGDVVVSGVQGTDTSWTIGIVRFAADASRR